MQRHGHVTQINETRKLLQVAHVLFIRPSQERFKHGADPDLVLVQIGGSYTVAMHSEEGSFTGLEMAKLELLSGRYIRDIYR